MHPLRPFTALACTALSISLLIQVPAQDPPADSTQRSVAGITEPVRDATLGSPTGGIISVIHYKEGETVQADEIILELHHETETIEVSRQETIVTSTDKRLERVTELHESANVSDEELEEAQAKAKIAKAEHDLAVTKLEQRLTRAPFTGIISDLFTLEVGEAVQIEYPVARLIDSSRCLFVAHVHASLAAGLEINPLSPHLRSPQPRSQEPHLKSKFLAITHHRQTAHGRTLRY